MTLRVAVAAWKLRRIRGDGQYFGHFHDLVSAAHDEGANVVVFPELHVLELLPLAPDLNPKNAAKYLVQYGEAVEEWLTRIADSSGMVIVGGSHFRQADEGIKNVSAIAAPGKALFFGEKNNLTRYERETWNLTPGTGLAKLPKHLGVTVCYDAEFPQSVRALAEAGALVNCVPSWTDDQRGFQRVRWCCMARAVENQIFVVHSSLVGSLGAEPVPSTFGSSAIIAPSIAPFPVNAVLRETEMNEEGVVLADLDLAVLRGARKAGEVSNWNDRSCGSWCVGNGGLS